MSQPELQSTLENDVQQHEAATPAAAEGVAMSPPPFQLTAAEGDMEGEESLQLQAAPGSTGPLQLQDDDEADPGLAVYLRMSPSELISDINGNLFDSLLAVQTTRIETWRTNANVVETPPGRVILEIALGILAAGIGKMIGGTLTRVLSQGAGQLMALAIEGTAEGVAGAITNGTIGAGKSALLDMTTPGNSEVSSAAGTAVGLSTSTSLADYFAEGSRLMAATTKTNKATNFIADSSDMSHAQLIVMHYGLRRSIDNLVADGGSFMQGMTIGFLKLLDELYLTEQAADYSGSTETERRDDMYTNDGTIAEANSRQGNVIVLNGRVSSSIGRYNNANVSGVRGGVDELNESTRDHLSGAKIEDLPMSVGFRFWGTTHNAGLFGSSMCKVWFTRQANGSIGVDQDQSWETDGDWDNGREWLARHSLNTDRDLTDDEIRDNCAAGARKLYNSVKGLSLGNIQRMDMF